MPAQVTQWIYENMDWAFAADQTFHYSKTANTLNDIFKIVSCTPQLPNASLIYDHAVDNNYGLIVRPVTGYLSNNAGTATGVFDFTISETQDNKWKAEENAIYGQIRTDDLIKMVWQACGLNVAESWQNTYLIRCRRHLIAGRSVCNAHITNNVGTCCLYVRKRVIDEIIEAMDVEGMFMQDHETVESVTAGLSYEWEPNRSTDTLINSAYTFVMNSRAIHNYADRISGNMKDIYDYWRGYVSYSEVMSKFNAWVEDNNIDLTGKLINVQAHFSLTGSSKPALGVTVKVYHYLHDAFTPTVDTTTTDMSQYSSQDEVYSGKYLDLFAAGFSNQAVIDGICYMHWYGNTDSSVDYSTATVSTNTGIANYTRDRTLSGYESAEAAYTNYGTADIYPEGITAKEGATTGEEGTTSSDFWPSWAGGAITLQTVSIDTFDFDTATFIPIGYGSATSDYTQYDMQHGKIKGKPYLQALGVVMEDIEDFLPVVYDPDDPDDPSNPPIINPDTQPESTPTPTDESSASESASRLFTVHKLSNTEVDALGNFLYSNDFISAIQNMFTEPMDAIIGCFILHYHGTLPLGANETLKLGSILGTSGVTGDKVTNQYMDIDFGSITIPEFYGNVEDYAPYSKAEIFLPYIGFCAIDVNDVMGASVKLKYTIDIFTGACVARIFVTKNGTTQEVYNFNGNCAAMVPLTNRDFTQGVSHLLTGAVGIIGGIASGGATGVLSATVGASHLMGSPVGTKRSGSVGSNLGAMSNQTPFIMIHRPRAYNAANWPYFYGQPSWWSTTLGRLSGYTRVKEAHLDGINCTDDERREIERLLKQGVMV